VGTFVAKLPKGNMQSRHTNIEIDVTALGSEGIAIGRIDGVVHFVKGALPGERVLAQVVKSHSRHREATAIEILQASPERVEAPCPYYEACGGCSWQHLAYQAQVRWKQQHVVDAFERLGKVHVGHVRAAIESPLPFGYRNKMEFSFGASRWLTTAEIDSGAEFERDYALGLHIPGRFDKVLHVEHCMLQSNVGNTVLEHTQRVFGGSGIRAYHARRHEGLLRNLVVRTSATTGAVMVVLITSVPSADDEVAAIERWFATAPELAEGSSMIHATNATKSSVATGTIMRQEGPGFLEERSMDIWYRISPFSFFQTNTHHLPNLVECALEAAELQADDVVWDLYCGTGTLTLPAARRVRHVIGAELAESSVADGRANAERNGIENVEWHALDLHAKHVRGRLEEFDAPRIIIVDPPRAGMHGVLVEHILAVAPERIAYVSCNPATQARDCALLDELYEVEWIRPVDMFPQTFHVENVAALRRRSS